VTIQDLVTIIMLLRWVALAAAAAIATAQGSTSVRRAVRGPVPFTTDA
jgi:hypothetical protein